MSPRLALEAVGVRASGRDLLADVDLRLDAGEVVALVGPNGAGKTTLLRAALGLVPTTGRVLLDGRPLAARSPRERAAALGWLPQHTRVAEPIPVVDLVAAARFRHGEGRAVAARAARAALASVGAAELADRPASALSGGEAQRVALAALVAQEAALLLLDEPANHLDPRVQRETWAHLARWWADGRGLLLVTHDVNLLAHLGDPARVQVVGLDAGRVAFRAPLDAPALPGHLGALFGVRVDVLDVRGHRHLVLGAP